jgi:XTP/dITP diphosphohydrolase
MILATNNTNKLREIKEIFNEYELYSLKDKNIDIDVIEDADTFAGNALKKAKEIYAITHEPVMADDSGLCIDCLDGYPGVLTHRFLGENASELERNIYLINEVNKYTDRSAEVVCILAYYDGERELIGEGILKGTIPYERRGENGFGFDKIFELPNGKTLTELTPEEKNQVSARALAALDLKNKLLTNCKHNI